MFAWCFGRQRLTSSMGDATTMQTHLEPSMLQPIKPQVMSRNPFSIDLVIEVMLEEAKVKKLKKLRKLDSNWNQLAIKELENRSMNGQLEKIELSSGCQVKLDEFLEDTAGIPKLFASFCLSIPNSFKFVHYLFYKYPPMFLSLEFHDEQFTEIDTKYLRKVFSWIAQNLKELKIKGFGHRSTPDQVIQSPSNGPPIVFHKLSKLTWDISESCDAKDHILFQFILDKCGAVDPTPNLTTLEASINEEFLKMMDNRPNLYRWTQLTILRVQDRSDDYFKFPTTLLKLGQAGMRLKLFALATASPLVGLCPEFWGNWSQFLATQAKSLQVLELQWFCGFDEVTDEVVLPKIRLPSFESLHTLQFYLECEVYTPSGTIEPRIFEMGGFRDHFPKVVHMRINDAALRNIFPVGGVPISLKSLTILGGSDNWEDWDSRIQSVESQSTPEVGFPYYHY